MFYVNIKMQQVNMKRGRGAEKSARFCMRSVVRRFWKKRKKGREKVCCIMISISKIY